MFFQLYGETAGWQLLGWLMVFAGLVVMNEVARRSKAGGIACFGGADNLFYCNLHWRGQRCGVGAEQRHLRAHEQLVPLCEAVRSNGGLYRFHDPQIPLGQTGKIPGV